MNIEIKLLDKILLSENVVKDFYNECDNNAQFKNWLDEILPEIEACKKQAQNNPWHKYNVLGHILHSVEEMNKQTLEHDFKTRRMLAYTMLLHDIGKPASHIVRMKDGKAIDSFFNHNIKSCDVTKRVLPQLNFDRAEIEIITKLVYKHDIFMFIKDFPTDNPHWRTLSFEVIKSEIADLNSVGNGNQLMKYLIMIGRSDNLAQNEKMTAASLRMLEKMERMLEKM